MSNLIKNYKYLVTFLTLSRRFRVCCGSRVVLSTWYPLRLIFHLPLRIFSYNPDDIVVKGVMNFSGNLEVNSTSKPQFQTYWFYQSSDFFQNKTLVLNSIPGFLGQNRMRTIGWKNFNSRVFLCQVERNIIMQRMFRVILLDS